MLSLYSLLLKLSKTVRQRERIVSESIAITFDDNRTFQSAIEELQMFYLRELPEYVYTDSEYRYRTPRPNRPSSCTGPGQNRTEQGL